MSLVQTVRVDLSELLGEPHDPPYFASIIPPTWLTFDLISSFNALNERLKDTTDEDIRTNADLRGEIEDMFAEMIQNWNIEVPQRDDKGRRVRPEVMVALEPPVRDPSSIWKVPFPLLWMMLDKATEVLEPMKPGSTIPLVNENSSLEGSQPQPPQESSQPVAEVDSTPPSPAG